MTTLSKKDSWRSAISPNKILYNVAFYPLNSAKILIQTGYEPLPAALGKSPMGVTHFYYPNLFQIVQHMHKSYGFTSLYSGLGYRLMGNCISTGLMSYMGDVLTDYIKIPGAAEAPNKKKSLAVFLEKQINQTISCWIATIAAYPCLLLMVRTVAAIPDGPSSVYTIWSPFQALKDVFFETGSFEISRIFRGLGSQMIASTVNIWMVGAFIFAYNSFFDSDPEPEASHHAVEDGRLSSIKPSNTNMASNFVKQMAEMVSSIFTYPYTVTSITMMVSGAKIGTVISQDMPNYSSSKECFKELTRLGVKYRGSGMFWRVAPTSVSSISTSID